MNQDLGYTKEARGQIPEIVETLAKELKQRGFGVLSNIDVQKLIKEKTGADMDPYVILDVCNPHHAKGALDAHKEVGLALPCKIVVYRNGERNLVSLYRPTKALSVLGFDDLQPVAELVEAELRAAVDAVAK